MDNTNSKSKDNVQFKGSWKESGWKKYIVLSIILTFFLLGLISTLQNEKKSKLFFIGLSQSVSLKNLLIRALFSWSVSQSFTQKIFKNLSILSASVSQSARIFFINLSSFLLACQSVRSFLPHTAVVPTTHCH